MAFSPPDWSSHWEPIDDQGNERVPAEAMIDWLSGQAPAVWHAYARDFLDLEKGAAVAEWIVRQPACDRATASLILFRLEPGYHLELHRLGGIGGRPWQPHPLIGTILALFDEGRYRDSRIEQEFASLAQSLACYRRVSEHIESSRRIPPFVIPDELTGRFEGETARFPAAAHPFDSPRMWALMNRLGHEGLNAATKPWYNEARAAGEKWLGQWRQPQAGALQRWLRQHQLLAPHGPLLRSEAERRRYLAGDADMAGVLRERARTAARKEALREGRWGDLLRLVDWPQPVWTNIPWEELGEALASALPLPRFNVALGHIGGPRRW